MQHQSRELCLFEKEIGQKEEQSKEEVDEWSEVKKINQVETKVFDWNNRISADFAMICTLFLKLKSTFIHSEWQKICGHMVIFDT